MTPFINDADTIKKAKQGHSDSMEAVVTTNLGLVKSIAVRFVGRGVELEDLIQIGTVGMLKAIRGFDPDKECRFTTYAVPLIMGEIKRFLRDDGWIKVSREVRANAATIFRFSEAWEKKHGTAPTLDVIVRETGLSEEKIAVALSSSRPALSLYAKDEETGICVEDLIGQDSMEDAATSIALRQAVSLLPEWERKLITLRYFKGLTQEQTARILGVTQVKISREEKRILAKLRQDFLE